jgi:hypothetical protein
LIDIEIQNETRQTQFRLKVVVVPRIGEGLRLQEADGRWASYDVLDVWYQKAEYGEVWVPYLHVRMTAGEDTGDEAPPEAAPRPQVLSIHEMMAQAEANASSLVDWEAP